MEKVLIKTIINRCVKLAGTGFLIHSIVKERILVYSLSAFSQRQLKTILEVLNQIYVSGAASSGRSVTIITPVLTIQIAYTHFCVILGNELE